MGSHASLYAVSLAPEDVRAVLDDLRRIVRALRTSAGEAEEAAGISGAQLFLLQRLVERPARSIAELAERTLTDPSSVSVLVGHLADKGLIVRTRSPADGRKSELALSRRGMQLLEKVPVPAQARLIEALAAMPGLERRTLARVLGRLAEAMGAADQAPGMFFEDDKPGRKGKPRG